MMKRPEFKVGDKVYLEKGVEVEAHVPEKYVYSNRPFSESLTWAMIHLGVLYTNEETTKRDIEEEANHIANIIFDAFINKGYEISFDKCKEFVKRNINIEKKIELTKFLYPEGTFTITDVIYHREATCWNDTYPPYWEFYAKRENDKEEIHFVNWQYYNDDWHFINEQQPKNDKRCKKS